MTLLSLTQKLVKIFPVGEKIKLTAMGIFRNPRESAQQMALDVGGGLIKLHSQSNAQRKMEASMHALQAVVVVAVIIIGLGAKLAFFPASEANRGAVQSASLNVLQVDIHRQNANDLPAEKIHDMTFVDPRRD